MEENYRKRLQEDLDESGENYILKTNEQLIDIIADFGCGETEFHTADIERLLKEHSKLKEIVGKLTKLYISGERNLVTAELIKKQMIL